MVPDLGYGFDPRVHTHDPSIGYLEPPRDLWAHSFVCLISISRSPQGLGWLATGA